MLSRLTSAFWLLVTCAVASNAAMDFIGAYWIWGSDGGSPPPQLGPEQVAFRKTFPTPPCTPPTSVEVIITADDAYALYVNGVQVGSGEDWKTSQYYCVLTDPMDIQNIYQNRVVIAVLGANIYATAGVIARVKINYLGEGSDQFVTDSSWVSSLPPPSAGIWQAPNFDDSKWVHAVAEVVYPGWWGQVPAPTNQTCSLCSARTRVLTM